MKRHYVKFHAILFVVIAAAVVLFLFGNSGIAANNIEEDLAIKNVTQSNCTLDSPTLRRFWELFKENSECSALQMLYKQDCVFNDTANSTQLLTYSTVPRGEDFLSGTPVITDEFMVCDRCLQLKATYLSRCQASTTKAVPLYMSIIIAVAMSLVVGNVIAKYRFPYFPEVGVAIIFGVVVHITLHAIAGTRGNETFTSGIFFNVLLPPIIFYATAFCPDGPLVYANFPSLLVMAVLGTIVAVLSCAMLTWWWNLLPFMESLLFGTLISSIDPVSILAIFSNFGVDPQLTVLVFGESMMNDGVALVLFDSLVPRIDSGVEWSEVSGLVFDFFIVFSGSTFIGLASGLLIAFIFEHIHFHHSGPQTECVLLFMLAFSPYYLCSIMKWSGIVCLLFEGFIFNLYVFQNVSDESNQHIEFFFGSLANVCETAIFVYLGMSLVQGDTTISWDNRLAFGAIGAVLLSRVASVVVTTLLLNIFRVRRIDFTTMMMIWYSGMRGAMSLALVTSLVALDPVVSHGSEFVNKITFMTRVCVVYSTFVHGCLAVPFMRLLGIYIHELEDDEAGKFLLEEEEKEEEDAEAEAFRDLGLLLRWIYNHVHIQFLKPLLTGEPYIPPTQSHAFLLGYGRSPRIDRSGSFISYGGNERLRASWVGSESEPLLRNRTHLSASTASVTEGGLHKHRDSVGASEDNLSGIFFHNG